ncbi:MAG: prepilin-type N-terminal cleavage/methylation domain-containing protein [Candidatus Eremiobacterota bacterium]
MRRCAGHTLPEVLVACTLFSLIIGVAFSSLALMSRARQGTEARVDPRRETRALLDLLSNQLRSSAHMRTDTDPQMFCGVSYSDAPKGPGQWGTMLLFSVPEQAAGTSCAVWGVHGRNRIPRDGANPDARQVVVHSVRNVRVDAPGSPSTVVLGPLAYADRGFSQRVFDTYGDARFHLSTDLRSVTIEVAFRRRAIRGPVMAETYSTEVSLRNQ